MVGTLNWTFRIQTNTVSVYSEVWVVVFFFFFGDSPAFGLYVTTFRNTLSVPSSCAVRTRRKQYSQYGESWKSRIKISVDVFTIFSMVNAVT